MKVEEFKMKMYGVKNEVKNVVGFVDESRKLKIELDNEVFNDVFERDFDSVMLEVEMLIENLCDVIKVVEFKKNDENYDVYLNGTKYEFDY